MSNEPEAEVKEAPCVPDSVIALCCAMNEAKETLQNPSERTFVRATLRMLRAIGAHQLTVADELRAMRKRLDGLEALRELESDLPDDRKHGADPRD